MQITRRFVLDQFKNDALVKDWTKVEMLQFRADPLNKEKINESEFQEINSPSEFYMPVYISWSKTVDAENLLMSDTVSAKRKKIIRQAISQSERQGIKYEIVNPLTFEEFEKFREYYEDFNRKMGYQIIMSDTIFAKYSAKDLFLVKVMGPNGEFYGGRLLRNTGVKISTEYRAIERTRNVKEGYDTVCEKIAFDIAVQENLKQMGRGKEFNLKGLGNRSVGLLWNKLKYGYAPKIMAIYPRVYVDLGFLKDEKFNLVFFISLENARVSSIGEEKLTMNFVLGDDYSMGEINSVKEKSRFPVRVYDRDFNLVSNWKNLSI